MRPSPNRCFRAVVLFLQASHPPNRILSDPLKSILSLLHERQRRTLIFSSASRSEVEVESQFVFLPALAVRPSARTQSGFIALDTVNVREVIAVRACVMKVAPAFLRGAYKLAMRLALQEIVSGIRSRISWGSQEGGSCLSCFPEFCRVPPFLSHGVAVLCRD